MSNREELIKRLIDVFAQCDEKVREAMVAGYALGVMNQPKQPTK